MRSVDRGDVGVPETLLLERLRILPGIVAGDTAGLLDIVEEYSAGFLAGVVHGSDGRVIVAGVDLPVARRANDNSLGREDAHSGASRRETVRMTTV